MSKYQNDVKVICDNGLCTGCGTCEPICHAECIKISMGVDGQYFPLIDKSLCINCGLCLKVCPSTNINYKKNIKEPIAVYNGFTRSNKLRRESASGGFVSQLLINGLNNNDFDAVVVIGGDKPENYKVSIVANSQDVIKFKGSKYSQIPTNIILTELYASSYKKIAYVGLPCQIKALTKYLNIKKAFSSRIKLKVSLVCGQTLKHTTIQKQLSALSIKKENLQYYSFRGDGWPGKQIIKFDGKTKKIPHTSFLAMGGLFSSPLSGVDACLFCDDHFGSCADISFCDAWHLLKQHSCDGISSVLCYTQTGVELIKKQKKEDNLYIWKDEFNNIRKVQGHMKPSGSLSYLLRKKNLEKYIKFRSEMKEGCISKIFALIYMFSLKLLKVIPIKFLPVKVLALTRILKKLIRF